MPRARRRTRRSRSEPRPPIPKPRGDADKALAKAAAQVDVEYLVPAEHHNPMEPFATTAVWENDGTLTVYDKTQGVQNVQGYLCSVFGWPEDEVRVVRAVCRRRIRVRDFVLSIRCSLPFWRRTR